MVVRKTKAQLKAEYMRIIAKERKLEEARHKASLKSLKQRAKLNRVVHLGY